MQIQNPKQSLPDSEFLADLCDDPELASILGVQPQTIPVMRARGRLQGIAQYRRGRKTFSSRSDAVAMIRASRIS